MDYQLLAVAIIVAGAAFFIGRSWLKALRGAGKGCGSGCGKCAATKEEENPRRIPLGQIKN